METGRVLLSVILLLASLTTTIASKSYIVYFGGHPPRTEVSSDDYERAKDFHHEFLASFMENKEKAQDAIFHSYKHINAFAAHLSDTEALEISNHPQVLSVIPNTAHRLHTTRTWGFLGLERDGRIPHMSVWNKGRLGEDVIIGSLDTGVWPESQSFNDDGMGPVPSRWKGFCQNNTKKGVPCNKYSLLAALHGPLGFITIIIGARYFNKGVVDNEGSKEPFLYSARDVEGHGSHTLSTAAGRFVPGANIFGLANGTAAGGSPNARVAMYKVCYSNGCYSVDILSGFDAAIDDGVDIISVSLGGSYWNYFDDAVAVGSFHAMMKGITVVCSAGNDGPQPGTVSNGAPWIITVAASTLDREFDSYLRLGSNKCMKGQSISSEKLPEKKLYPMIDSTLAKLPNKTDKEGRLCYLNALDPEKVKGKIVVCLRGVTPRLEKGLAVLKAGGVGMIIANSKMDKDGIQQDPHILPATHISYFDGVALYSYLNSTKSPTGYIEPPITTYHRKPAPFVADFSSRGPNLITPQILKPDITAPGVLVLAAYNPEIPPTIFDYDTRHVTYNLLSGTSMSCPHISGIAGLLKTLHPDWSPSMIRSAIMTTATTRDNTMKPVLQLSYDSYSKASPFDYGSGHVRPNRAMYPGLVYDVSLSDYLDLLCALGYNSSQIALFSDKPYSCPSKPMKVEDLNYPSISIAKLTSTTTVTRAVTNVGPPGIYNAKVKAPVGVSVSVEPKTLKFHQCGEVRKFKVTLEVKQPRIINGYTFGGLIWSDGKHYVRSPIVVNVPES